MLLAGCPDGAGDSGDTDAGTETGAPVELEPPVLLEPLDEELILPVTRTDDIVLGVTQITPGVTRVVLDGKNVGPLSNDNRIGTLTSDTLTLRLAGAMVPGDHQLKLRTPGALDDRGDPLESREVTLRINGATTPVPVASVGDTVSFNADAILTAGYDSDGVLIAVDQEADPAIATAYRGAGGGWDLSTPSDFELRGFVPDGDPRHGLSGCVHTDTGTADERVRVVWRVGAEGTAINVGDRHWPDGFAATRTALVLDELVDTGEYARLGRPLIYGSTVVAELLHTRNAEQLLPGDRTVVTVKLSGSPPQPLTPQITTVVGQNDIEFLSPAIDPVGHAVGRSLAFAARVAGVRPVVFTLDEESGGLSIAVTEAADRLSLLGDLAAPMVTVLGAFDSRQVFSPLHANADGARVMISYFDDGLSSGASDASPNAGQLVELGDPTGAIVATILHGAPVYVVPQGPDTPAFGFTSTGPSPTVGPIEGLACDEVAIPVASEGINGDAVQLACRRGRDVFLGTLRAGE